MIYNNTDDFRNGMRLAGAVDKDIRAIKSYKTTAYGTKYALRVNDKYVGLYKNEDMANGVVYGLMMRSGAGGRAMTAVNTYPKNLGTTVFVPPPLTPASPVTGDIIDCTITTEAGGMTYASIKIKGFTTGATYNFGLGVNNDPSTAKMVFAVRSEGFDSAGNLTTIDRIMYGTRVMQKVYPNAAQLDETVSGSDLIVKVALSNFIYNDDKDGGAGTSGRNPTITTLSGWATNTGGGAQSATAVYLSCTNNSTTDYPLPFGQWDIVTHQRYTTDFRMAFTPRHTHGIACCKFTAVGQLSAIPSTQTTSVMGKRLRPSTGLYGEAYEITMGLSQFTQGESIDLRCRVYPTIGDTEMDTNNYTVANEEIRGRNKATGYCDKNNTPTYAVVNASTGNDGTAVVSTTLATANASPYLNIGKAIQGLGTTGGIVYVRTGTMDIFGSQPSSVLANTFWTEVMPYPGDIVTLTFGATSHTNSPRRLKFSGFNLKRLNTLGAVYGNASNNHIWYDNNAFDDNGISNTFSLSEDFITTRMTNNTGIKLDKWGRAGFGSHWDGNTLTDIGNQQQSDNFRFVCNDCKGFGLKPIATASPFAPDFDNGMWEHNKILALNSTDNVQVLVLAAYYATNQSIGLSVCGNIIESCDSLQPALELFDGGASECSTANVIIESNTVAGSRTNGGYNDAGSVAYPRNGWSMKNNAFHNFSVKGNEFTGNPGGANGARTGSFNVEYGVNFERNCIISTSFPGYFTGLYSDYATVMDWGDDQSSTGGDNGNGDYTPMGGTSLINKRPGQVKWDLLGQATTTYVGAVQR